MKHSPQIKEELYQVAPLLAKSGKMNVFIVQNNYFDLLSDRIIDQVTATSFKPLPTSETLFLISENYFSVFPGHLMARIKEMNNNDAENEIEQLSPLLHSLKNTNVFSVDPAFFSQFTAIPKKAAPVVKMAGFSSFWKYASAAAIAGVMAASALLIENNNENDSTSSIASELRMAKAFKNTEQLTNAINGLSADDIVNYLDETSTIADETDLANSIVEKELPTSEKYLTDENALNEYLNKIDLKSSNN